MKILSYNLYGVKDTEASIPNFGIRCENIKRIMDETLIDDSIKICCFQEVNQNNISLLDSILNNNNFKMLEKFPMKTASYDQYNVIAVKKDIKIDYTYCLPHGADLEYKNIDEQVIDYGMSDYRTTVFVRFLYNNKRYLVGCIHTDYISTDGKIIGTVKSLNYMDNIEADHKILVGDMNMVPHMSEVYNILKQNNNYITLSRSKNFDIDDNSWHGYGTMEQVNVDFAFVLKKMINNYDYYIIKQSDTFDEGSDHRPIIISID